MKKQLRELRYTNEFFFQVTYWIAEISRWLGSRRQSDEAFITVRFNRLQPYPLNLKQPETLNAKLQWLKLHDRRPEHVIYADKYSVRDYIGRHFGSDLLIPLHFYTTNYRDISPGRLPDTPCIVKGNNGFGNSQIIRDKGQVDWHRLQTDCRLWLRTNYYWMEREWQYKDIPPKILVEQLLVCRNGRIPNDYKLHCINGTVEFVYVSVDREGVNKRNIYDKDWKPLHFTWNRKGKDLKNMRGDEVPPPATYPRMVEIAETIAKQFKYVRVDFYDVDGKLFFGEITQCHGGGFDQINPTELDYFYGSKINVND